MDHLDEGDVVVYPFDFRLMDVEAHDPSEAVNVDVRIGRGEESRQVVDVGAALTCQRDRHICVVSLWSVDCGLGLGALAG